MSELAPIKPSSPGWTREQDEMLKAHHAQGISASQSAAIFGPPVTRNAVIGKWKRMGMPPRRAVPPPSIRPQFPTHGGLVLPKIKAAQHKRNAPSAPLVPFKSRLSPDDIPRFQRRTVETLGERHCRFPYGDPGAPDFFFCGAVRVDPGRPIDKNNPPYCDPHCRVAYIAGSARKQWNDVEHRVKTGDPESIARFSGYSWLGKAAAYKP